MGLLSSIFGENNPAAKWAGQNHGLLSQWGAGLAAGPTFGQGLANAAQLGPAGQLIDQQAAKDQQDTAEREAAINQSAKDLAKFPDLMQAVASKAISPAEAYGEAWKRMSPDYAPDAPDPFTLGPGQVRFGPDNKPIAEGPAAIKQESAPTGYRYGPDGNLAFIPGGPADPATAGKTTEATRRNQQLAKVIVPELTNLLGDGSVAGTFEALANPQDQMRSMGGDFGLAVGQGPSPQYQQAQNSLKTIIASYLYSVSGATANPGEVETQAAVLTPKLGESPESVAQKKARITQMVQAVVDAAQGTNMPPQAGMDAAPKTFTYNPATGELE